MTRKELNSVYEACNTLIDYVVDQPLTAERQRRLDMLNAILSDCPYCEAHWPAEKKQHSMKRPAPRRSEFRAICEHFTPTTLAAIIADVFDDQRPLAKLALEDAQNALEANIGAEEAAALVRKALDPVY